MALSFVSTGGFVAGAAAISVTAPAGGQSGDLILLFVNTANQAPPSTPTLNSVAMTSVGSIGTGTGGNAGATAIYVYRAVHNGTSYAAAVGDSGSYQSGAQVYLRGQHATTPISGTPVTRVDASATTTVTWPSPGTPGAAQWVVQAIGLDNDANNAAYDVFSTSPTNSGWQGNGVVDGSGFDTGATTQLGAGGGLWVGVFDYDYALSGGTYSNSTTHAQITFIIDVAASTNATLTTTVGNATAGGGEGALTGTGNGTLSTTVGDAAAAGLEGSLTGTANATLTTTGGDAAAAGGTGAIYAAADASLSTTTGDAAAEGGTGALRLSVVAYGGSASGSCWVDPSNATGSPDDSYATWTSAVAGETSCELVVGGFGTWAGIPDGSTIDSVTVSVQHHESATGDPLDWVTAQAYLGSTPLGTATNLTLSLTDRDDLILPSLTLADLQGNTLAVRIIGDRA